MPVKEFKKRKINIKVAEAQSRYFFAFTIAGMLFKGATNGKACAEAMAQLAYFKALGYKVRVKQ